MRRRRRTAPPDPSRKPDARHREKRPPQREPKRKGVPTVDVHLRVALEDVIVRLSAADYHKLVVYWKLGEQSVILRGPYDHMETDIILRGTDGGMVSVRPHAKKVQGQRSAPPFKLVLASEMRKEMLDKNGL